MLLRDVPVLSKADDEDKKAILEIRGNLNFNRLEELRGKEIRIRYETQIPQLDQWNLGLTIQNAKKNFLKSKINEKDIEFF
jgi:hypothetical protein